MGHAQPLDRGDIRRALQCGEFFPDFQPLVVLATGKLHGFEVLARWEHPDFGLVPPDEFIPMAEREGWICEVSRQVLQKAFQAIALHGKGLRLAFNISPLQLQDLALPEHLRRLAEFAGFSLEYATAEITESAMAQNMTSARTITRDLKAMGCRIALDDFGTGYSSLYHLKSLPFDELKVDRSFVSSMTTERESRKIVAAVVGLGQSLGLSTIAEGIETEEQADMLLRLGCDMGQGWHYGRPAPAEQLPSLIELRRPRAVLRSSDQGVGRSVVCREGLPSQRLDQLQAVYDGAPVGLAFLDRDLKYININRRLADMHGLSIEDHYGKTLAEVIPELYPLLEAHVKEALSGKGTYGLEIREPASHGHSRKAFLASYQPAFDEAGEVVGVSCAVVDFTARKAAEDQLGQYERLVEGLDEMVAVVDRNYRYLLTNRAFLKVFGEANARLEGRPIREFRDREVIERIVIPYLDLCFRGSPVLFSMDYDLPGIGVRDLSVSFSPIEVSGEVETVACVLRDITDMKRIEFIETGWRKRIELAECAGLHIGLWDWDIGTNTVIWSDESYRQWGFTRDTFSSKVADAVPRIHPADRPFVESAIRMVIARETDEYAAQYRVLRPDGSICWIDARGAMMGDASQRMVGIGIDITDHMKTQDPTSHSASDLYC
ncbi:MAG: EAL domain-containing protein [Terracidiphilus sp.]|nr:EAL domain-containing protein [Terracidiphilus sp.]